jgi:Ca2+-binding RTX toxin-like protein
MTISAAEQYMIELLNRARLDPLGEAALNKISLNQGLAANTLGTQARQVLAPDQALEDAAIAHSQWMLAVDQFSHTGIGGSTPSQRVETAGYDWNRVGENISWLGTTGALSLEKMIVLQHQALFKSAPHRVNILLDGFRELGVAQEAGAFKSGAHTFNASMVTQNFGTSGSDVFITGVAYTDTNKDNFYSIGEGTAGVSLSAQGVSDSTQAAGGYALALTGGGDVAVNGRVGALDFSVTVALDNGNVKLDVVNANTFFTSGDIKLGTGINDLRLLGTGALEAEGNNAANKMFGNAAANSLSGQDGADLIYGAAGADTIDGGADADQLWGEAGADNLLGGTGLDLIYGGVDADRLDGGADADTLWGDLGSDTLQGGSGADLIYGGNGFDWLQGGADADVLSGGKDRDTFVFMNGDGADRISDYSVKAKEVLLLDDALWGGVAMTEAQVVKAYAQVVNKVVVFDFGDGDVLTLTGVRSVSGIAALIDII